VFTFGDSKAVFHIQICCSLMFISLNNYYF